MRAPIAAAAETAVTQLFRAVLGEADKPAPRH